MNNDTIRNLYDLWMEQYRQLPSQLKPSAGLLVQRLGVKLSKEKLYQNWLNVHCEDKKENILALNIKARHLYNSEHGYSTDDKEILKLLKKWLEIFVKNSTPNEFKEAFEKLIKDFPRLATELTTLAAQIGVNKGHAPFVPEIKPLSQKSNVTVLQPIKPMPRKFKLHDNIERAKVIQQPITEKDGFREFSHPIAHVHKKSEKSSSSQVSKDEVWIQKFPRENHDYQPQTKILQCEAFASQLYRVMMLDNAPKNRVVVDNKQRIKSIISKNIEGFIKLKDFYSSKDKNYPIDEDSFAAGIVSAFAFEENDLRDVNCGFKFINGKAVFVKIDHDQSLISATGTYHGFDNHQYYIPITQDNIANLPLKPKRNAHRNTNGPWQIPADLNYDKRKFEVAKHKYFLKHLLIGTGFVMDSAVAHIDDPVVRDRMINAYVERQNTLRQTLLEMPEFRNFVLCNPQIHAELIEQFQAFNNLTKFNAIKDNGREQIGILGVQQRLQTLILDIIKINLKAKPGVVLDEKLYNALANSIYTTFNTLKRCQPDSQFNLVDYLKKLTPEMLNMAMNNSQDYQSLANDIAKSPILELFERKLAKFDERNILQKISDSIFRAQDTQKINLLLEKFKNAKQNLNAKIEAINNYAKAPAKGHPFNTMLLKEVECLQAIERNYAATKIVETDKRSGKSKKANHNAIVLEKTLGSADSSPIDAQEAPLRLVKL